MHKNTKTLSIQHHNIIQSCFLERPRKLIRAQVVDVVFKTNKSCCSIPHGIYLRFSDEFWMFPKQRAVVICYGVQSTNIVSKFRFIQISRALWASRSYYYSTNEQQNQLHYPKKNFLSIHRTSQAIKHKSAATKFTFAATFCSIIIERGSGMSNG